MNGTPETVERRPALQFERRLPHSVARVWRAITEPAELARWFVAPVDWKPELGETWTASGQAGVVTELEPSRVLAWTWNDEQFRFELGPDPDGCVLRFTHVFADPALGPAQAAGWEAYLDRLDAHLAGGVLSIADAHDARRVRLDAGPTLRLERRYDHSVERVWRAITDPADLGHWFPAVEQMVITERQRPSLLVGSWYGDLLRFELLPDGDGCRLRFSHTFAERRTAARDAAGWERCFARLHALLSGRPLSEADSLEAWPQAHERYAAQFGVDPELGRRAFAAHRSQR